MAHELCLHRGKDLASTAAFWTARFPRPPSKVLVTDFFGAVMDADPHKKVQAVSSASLCLQRYLCTNYFEYVLDEYLRRKSSRESHPCHDFLLFLRYTQLSIAPTRGPLVTSRSSQSHQARSAHIAMDAAPTRTLRMNMSFISGSKMQGGMLITTERSPCYRCQLQCVPLRLQQLRSQTSVTYLE